MSPSKNAPLSLEQMKKATAIESREFEEAYRWLEEHMPQSFLLEAPLELRLLIARHLPAYQLQDRFSQIQLPDMGIILTQDGPDADLKIVKHYDRYAVRHYRAFVSNEPPPGDKKGLLRIALIYLRDSSEKLSSEQKEEIIGLIRARNPSIDKEELAPLLSALTPRFVRSMTQERLKIALDMFFRAKKSDLCQYELRRNPDWKKKSAPSLQLIMAWKRVPKAGFLYRLARIIHAHGLTLQRIVAIDIDPYHLSDNIAIFSLALHGANQKPAWEDTDIDDLMRELVLAKYFESDGTIYSTFVPQKLLTGNEVHLVRNFVSFAHQTLVHADPNLYSFDHIVEDLCRHPELTVQLCQAFRAKFNPERADLKSYEKLHAELLELIGKIDTGQAVNDMRRKNTLHTALFFIHFTLKTNFYLDNKSAFSFRLDPRYLDQVPYKRREKFPDLPYGIFFIRGMHFIGFNLRFKDLARGGVRTVIPDRMESYLNERNTIFAEAYNLAYTQQKKNKDIPEGGAKTAILLRPMEVFIQEEKIYRQELEQEKLSHETIEERLKTYRSEQRTAYLLASQQSFIEAFMPLINCDEKGNLRSPSIIDYWQRSEYIYLGPDENLSNEMIVWIANYSVLSGYHPGRSFISSKPGAGINHKQYGVTSYGVNVYLHQVLLFLGINPEKEPFTVKISGGPDGDVAGNEILNLYKYYPNTAKLIALTDVSGTIFDPQGLDLKEMAKLFHEGLSIRHYSPEKLSDGGFLLDLKTKREESAYAQQTLVWRKQGKKLIQQWLSGNEMNHLYRSNVHQAKADVFIPGGGRPRTLNELNVSTFLDKTGKPTARAIVEGANLYLTPGARRALEKLGVLILKDSSCNKGGVICSSFEVLASLCMSEKEFLKEKEAFVKEVLHIIGQAALQEAKLLLDTYRQTQVPLSELSDKVSEQINLFKYQLLDHLEPLPLPTNPKAFLIRCLLAYCPPLMQKRYTKQILAMPDIHKKAVISCYIAAHLVYQRGLAWSPSIADVLPTLERDPALLN